MNRLSQNLLTSVFALTTTAMAQTNPYIIASDYSLGNHDIVRMNEDGTNLVRLTNWAGDEFGYDVSPDGTSMVFNSNISGTHQLYIMNLFTGTTQQITSSGENMFARWNHNGSRLLVSRANGSGLLSDLITMRPDGTDLHNLASTSLHEAQGEWNHDGTKIVFTKGNPNGGMDIWTMNANGSDQIQISNMGWDEWMPTWSPDSTKVVFHGLQGGNWEIMRVDSNGSNLVNISNHSGADQGPGWTNTGQILFTSHRQLDSIFRMNSDGSGISLVREGYFSGPRLENAVPEPITLATVFLGSLWAMKRTKKRFQ